MPTRDATTLSPALPARAHEQLAHAPRDTVVLLTSQLGIGGAERHTISLANLLGSEFRVALAYLKPRDDMIGLVRRESLLELCCLDARKRIDLQAARRLLALCQSHGARMIVCANAFALMHAQLARWLSPVPIVVVEIFHTTKPRTLKERLELAFYRPWFWAAHHLVFVCEAQRQYWRRRALWAPQTHMIYNGVDLSHFDPSRGADQSILTRAELGFEVGDRVVGICAVLRPEKAHVDLLAAVAQQAQDGQRWKVLMIGDGPLREPIEREIVRLGLSGSVRITGFQSDVRRWLAACDAVALVSTAIETFSIAALEAMAMGKPMIMSDLGGAREQVEHGVNGMLFPPGDVPALAKCLSECWAPGRTRQMGAAARSRVEREFSMETMIDRYVALFRRIFSAMRRGTGVELPRTGGPLS
ncbi:MAG: glycosyltransferase family 4 protein [Burkholderiales bacterium]